MNLDFSGLSRPAISPSTPKAWGQAGTVGTQGFMRVSAPQGAGDRTGTPGDGPAIESGCEIGATAVTPAHALAGPHLSPSCPREPLPGIANEINVSPSSPIVPVGDGCRTFDTDSEREAFEERAAIMEFDGGMTRAEAEAAAWVLVNSPYESLIGVSHVKQS